MTSLQLIFLFLLLVGIFFFIAYIKRNKARTVYKKKFAMQMQNATREHENTANADEWNQSPCVQSTHFIIIRLMAPKGRYYAGYELMQALLSAGLRYGSRNIFHFYEETEKGESILFSLASAVEPGTFELSQMGSFACPGLTLFMEYSSNENSNPLHRLTLMLDTVRQLAEDLGGEILTDKSKPLTELDIKQWRMQFETYEQNKEMGDLLTIIETR